MGRRTGIVNKRGFSKAFIVFITIILLGLLLGSGTFQTQEAQVLVFPDHLIPGSPVSVIVAIPAPVQSAENLTSPPDSSPTDNLPTAESPHGGSPNLRSLRAGELVPLQAILSNRKNKTIQSAPFFYVDEVHQADKIYTIVMATLVIPNTYDETSVNLEIQREKTVGIGRVASSPASGTGTISAAFMTVALPGRQSLPVDPRTFTTETISLGQENTDIKTKPDPQKAAESAELWKLLTTSSSGLYTMGGFAAPVDSNRRTSFFGDRRVYQYTNGSSERSIHGGIDFGVPRGTVVRATAPGLVLMARFRIVTGNTVVLQHAPGVYSLYYHMDSLSVTEGIQVDSGTELGKSGSTGLSTGPHLHWEFRIQGEFADPDLMVSLAPLDKERILRKILEKLNIFSTEPSQN
ncbi:M23 family metallopeptidase [Gracilinema caldarium]|uniref:Peptidase M23 n=1 Tax=Gracilinema caldarium (strain ATCC 51460 / DSM 7334 / H1) TaxID=744872 RepID=F8EXT4_GRAC1|nr:M23 family metallopeptidase [Gracilinema caldarium]AEJ20098.1 Peptidase M23 [Gracilinema caldarium DSM 7334]